MSRMNPQEYQILQDNKFNLYCSVLGVKEQCCFAPDKKVIERAFRKSALKCHPDKGGDPVVFKKLNEAYNKLIGHIGKLEQQTEAIELANSILIEISKTSVVKWHEKLKTRYGWFKTDNCKNIIFDGPYKQYMGRSKNTGNITVVLYEDPPDQIPKIHVRSSKYMAWIAEQMMPVHMHVEKGKTIQFDQWRIAHLAEFGICNFMSATPPTPAPEKKEPKPKPKTPKAKRREAREASERRAKTRRDSEPTPEPGEKTTGSENNKENTEPKPSEDDLNGKNMEEDEDVQQNPVIEEKPFNCGHCGEGFNNLMDYALHKKICVPDEDFGFASGMQDVINNQYKTEKKVGFAENLEKSKSAPESKKEEHSNPPQKAQASSKPQETKLPNSPTFQCEKCDEKFTNMVWYAKHKNACQIGKCTEPEATSTSDPVSERNTKCEEEESKSSKNIPTKVNISEEPQKQSSPQKHSKSSSMTNGQNDKSNNDINQKTTKEEVLTTRKEYKDTKIDIPMPPLVDNKGKEKSENKNEGIKTGHNVKNDNDSSQNTSKENILPTPKEPKKDTEKKLKENIIPTQNNVKDMEVDSSVQQPNKNKVEDITPKKSNPGMKTGKVTKPAKAAKLNGTLNKDDFDPKKKPETKTSVEAMDIDEPETKKAETPKTTPKKNDMPMGSLLTNLPTTAKPPPTADMETEKIVNKSKQQVDKQNSRQNITENEVPDKKSKPVVKFNLDMNSNSDIDSVKKHSHLDLDALELTNKIFSTTNNEEHEVKEAAPKEKDISTKALHHLASQSKVTGDLDKEAIKLTNVIFSNTNETIESEDMEAYLNSSKKPVSKHKAPLKSIMKNTTPKNIINSNRESEKTNLQNAKHLKAEENCVNLKQTSELSFSKSVENQDKDKSGQKSQIFDEKVFTDGLAVTQGGLNKDLTKEKENGINVNGIKDSSSLTTIDMKPKDNGSQISNNQKPSSHVMGTNDNKVTSLKTKPCVKTVEKDEHPILNGVQTNGNTPAHKSFTKNIAVNMTPGTKKKESNKEDHSNMQNSKKANVEKPSLDNNMKKKLVENKIGGSSTQMNNKNENSCAGQIYKEKQPGLEIAEAHKGKKHESTASKNLQNIEVKHAQQCFVVNQPLSPALNRKDIGQNSSQPQTDGRRLGSQSEIVFDKKQVEKAQITSVTKLPNTVNSESKKGVVVSQTPNDTKTKGENTKFLEPNKNSYSSQQIDDIPKRSDLNKDLEKMDKEHEVKMKNISKIMESSKEKTINLPKTEKGKNSHTSISEARQVIVDSQIPTNTKTKGGATNNSEQSVHNGLSLVPQALQRSYTSSYVETNSKSDLNKDLEKLDKRHAVKMQRIGEGIDGTTKEKKLDLSNSEVHANRPAILGPSRFDNPSKYSAEYPKENIPKRNDTVYNFNKESLPKINGTSGSSEKTQPSSYQISKSSTTVLDTRMKSPELLRKKLDRNFNASPEPFFSSKPSNSVHFSDQPSSKHPSLNPTTAPSTLSSLKDIKDNSARQFDTISTKSQSPGTKTPLSGSKSYSTLPSVSSLPAPSSLLPTSGSYSSSSYNASSSYSSPSFPSVASLPKPASYSSTSSFASQTPITKPTNYTSSTSPSTLSSPSNYAQSSNFDNRAKSEGSTLSTNSPGTLQSNYSLSTSSNKTSSDLYMKIQAAKDMHKTNIQNTMSVDKNNWKPPVIKQKFERPDPTPVKYTMTLGRDKTSRMQDRERTVIDRLMTDRTSRGKSDDFLKSSSYRL